jgi:hypothetical protein
MIKKRNIGQGGRQEGASCAMQCRKPTATRRNVMKTIMGAMAAIAAAPAIASAAAPADQDPIFAVIEAHDKARMAFVERLKTLHADEGVPYPQVQVIGKSVEQAPSVDGKQSQRYRHLHAGGYVSPGEEGATQRTVGGYCAL